MYVQTAYHALTQEVNGAEVCGVCESHHEPDDGEAVDGCRWSKRWNLSYVNLSRVEKNKSRNLESTYWSIPVCVCAVWSHYARDHAYDVGGDEGGVASEAVGDHTEPEIAHGTADEEHGLGERRDPVLVAHPIVLQQNQT